MPMRLILAAATIGLALSSGAVELLAVDRMAMADRLFDRGAYADAKAEYVALQGVPELAADEVLYRLAECEKALGDKAAARATYQKLLAAAPNSRHAAAARLSSALCAGTREEKLSDLKSLDNDFTPKALRAQALYQYGLLAEDADALKRSAELDPKGRYAPYAKFRSAAIRSEKSDESAKTSAIRELIVLSVDKTSPVAREALYLAAARSYAAKRYPQAAQLFQRYLKNYPDDAKKASVRDMAAWSEYLAGRYAECSAICGAGGTEETDYLLGASAIAAGDREKARALLDRYLAAHPEGKYRASAELPLRRLDFEAAEKSGDLTAAIAAAKRSAAISRDPADSLRLAWALERAGREDEAVEEYVEIAKSVAGSDAAAEAMFRKGLADARAKRWSAAELAFAEMIATGKSANRRAEAFYWRGIAAKALDHEAEAANFMREALALGLSLDQSREAKIILADREFEEENAGAAKDSYVKLVREGATDRMTAAKIRSVGKFLLTCKDGESAFPEAEKCGKALVERGGSAEWRQAGFILEGAALEGQGKFAAAIEAYRNAFAENVRTEDAAAASLALGELEVKAGDHAAAEKTLREAVKLNASDNSRRARAYLALAENALASGDAHNASAYATVVITLFDDPKLAARAQAIVDGAAAE